MLFIIVDIMLLIYYNQFILSNSNNIANIKRERILG